MSKVNVNTRFKRGSQNNQLVRFMFHEKRSVSRLSALTGLGIANLTARITDLRDAGYEIDTEIKVDMRGQKYASYKAITV
jgi:helix-turn-helix protein